MLVRVAAEALRFGHTSVRRMEGVLRPERCPPCHQPGTTSLARTIHRGLATACDPILHSIPASADLLKFEPPSAR
jgi:hypothetical protein